MSNDLFKDRDQLQEWWIYLSDIRDRELLEDETLSYRWKVIDIVDLKKFNSDNEKYRNSLIQIFTIPVVYKDQLLICYDQEARTKVLTYLTNKAIEVEEIIASTEFSLEDYQRYFNESIDSLYDVFHDQPELQQSIKKFQQDMNTMLCADIQISDTDNAIEDHIQVIKACINQFITNLSHDDLLLYTLDEDCVLLTSLWYARQYLYAKYYPRKDCSTTLDKSQQVQIEYVNHLIQRWEVSGQC